MIPRNKKKILIIVESINVEDSSGSKANVALIENLNDAGFHVKVYHYSRKEIQIDSIECINIKESKFGLNYFLSRFQRKIQHNSNLNLAKHLEPVFGFSFTFFNDTQSVKKALKNENAADYDLIITLSKGASFRPHYAILQLQKFHSKWMAYVHDPYPFHLYPEPYHWNEPGYLKKIEFFKEVAEKCKWVAYPSLYLQEWMEGHYEKFKDKGVIIPHQIKEVTEISKLPEYFDPLKFNLLHAGNLLKQRDPYPLLKAWKQFLLNNPNAEKDSQLLLVGPASFHEPILTTLSNTIGSVYRSKGYMPYKTVRQLEAAADVNIILEAVAEQSPFLPAKFPSLLHANKTILYLGPRGSECMRLLGKSYNYVAEANDVKNITHQIEKLYKVWKENPDQLMLNRPDLETYFSSTFLKEELSKPGIL